MLVLVAGLVVFFGAHSLRMISPAWRAARYESMGERTFKGVYSLVSLAGLVLIVWGWTLFRPDAPQVYVPPAWGRHVTSLFVLIAFVLVAAAYTPTGYMKAAVRHPMVLGILFWSVGHLLANGDLAGLLFFGAFLVYAVLNFFSVAGRDDDAPVAKGWQGDLYAVIAGLVGYAIMVVWLHAALFGVSPM